MSGIPVGNGIDINWAAGPDHKFNIGGAASVYATKDGETGIPSYYRYEGMPIWAKEGGVWKKYILSSDLVTWIVDEGGATQAELDAVALALFNHTQLENAHETTAEFVLTISGLTVEEFLQALRANVTQTESAISEHLLDKQNPHEVNASQIGTDDVNNSVQDFIDDFVGDIAAKVSQTEFNNHAASANPHVNLLAANVKTEDSGVSVQQALNTVKAAVAAIDTLDELTAQAAEINAGDINVKKALYHTPGTATIQLPAISFANKNIARMTVTGNLTIAAISGGKATGQYWIILTFSANATVTFTAPTTLSGLKPIQGLAGSTIVLSGIFYDSKFHFQKSQIFDLASIDYYFGVSNDGTVTENEVLVTTKLTDYSPERLWIPFEMTADAYLWLVAPITSAYLYKKEEIGSPYLITDNMFVTAITVSGVACYLYISKTKTKVNYLTFSLTNT